MRRKKIHSHSGQLGWIDKNKENSNNCLIIKIVVEVVIGVCGLAIYNFYIINIYNKL